MNLCIGVIGGNSVEESTLGLAEAVGRVIALKHATLVCGGRGGVMEAACRGAREAGGITIGILPGDNRSEANRYVDIPIVSGMGIGRNIIVVRSSQAIIALAGSHGTLSEISFALQLRIPVIGLKAWQEISQILQASTPEEAVGLAFERCNNRA